MTRGYFITGTDTDVGKTRIACALLAAFNTRGLTTAAFKPVASGCMQTPNGLRNDDALLLQQQASLHTSYDEVNPYAFAPAMAPHLTAQQAGVEIDFIRLRDAYENLAARADIVIVEGAGGWLVPLGPQTTVADLAQSLNLPVILVVGMRLGCLNHALLSAEAIRQRGLTLAGWVANSIDPNMAAVQDNITALSERLSTPLLGYVPWSPDATTADTSSCISTELLHTAKN